MAGSSSGAAAWSRPLATRAEFVERALESVPGGRGGWGGGEGSEKSLRNQMGLPFDDSCAQFAKGGGGGNGSSACPPHASACFRPPPARPLAARFGLDTWTAGPLERAGRFARWASLTSAQRVCLSGALGRTVRNSAAASLRVSQRGTELVRAQSWPGAQIARHVPRFAALCAPLVAPPARACACKPSGHS